LRTISTNPVMDKNPWVDCQVSIRILGPEKRSSAGMEAEARPDGDVNRRIPVRISFISTVWAHETSTAPFANLTAPGAHPGGVPRIDMDHRNTVLQRDGLKRRLKPRVRYSTDLPVHLAMALSVVESFQVLDRNSCVVLLGEVYDLMSDLIRPSGSEVAFVASEASKCSDGFTLALGSIRLKFGPPDVDVPLTLSNITTKVKLFQDSSIPVDDGDRGEGVRPDVNSNNCINFGWQCHISSEGDKQAFTVEFEISSSPAVVKMLLEPPVCTILCYWYCNPATHASDDSDGVSSARLSKFPASWNVERYADMIGHSTVGEDGMSVFEEIIRDLTVQPVFIPDSPVEHGLKPERARFFRSVFYNGHKCSVILTNEVVYIFTLSFRERKDVERDGLLHFHSNTALYLDEGDIYNFRQFLPPLKEWASLARGGDADENESEERWDRDSA